MYQIVLDGEQSVINVTLSGMMTLDEVAAYITDVRRTCVANRLREYAMVIDVRDCPIQQQDTIKAMGAHMATMPKARSLAVVTGSSLAKMQIRRLFTQPYARIVNTIEEGQAWVVQHVEPLPA
ncbi:hypothetical protein [Sphingomonas adhaesiva]|uniref:hypothetical protein n=1 Tax=Sphingomonas adhaesiva TaxID=28212 RepID=UPI002FF76B2F